MIPCVPLTLNPHNRYKYIVSERSLLRIMRRIKSLFDQLYEIFGKKRWEKNREKCLAPKWSLAFMLFLLNIAVFILFKCFIAVFLHFFNVLFRVFTLFQCFIPCFYTVSMFYCCVFTLFQWMFGVFLWRLFCADEEPYGDSDVYMVLGTVSKGERLPKPDNMAPEV